MKLENIKLGLQTRELSNTVDKINDEERTFVAVMATEYKVLRTIKRKDGTEFTFWEVIDHSNPDAFNRERIDNGGVSLNLDHDTSKVVGKTLDVWQEDGKTIGRFYVSKTAEDAWTQVKEGLRKLSLGYTVDRAIKVGADENGIPILRVYVTTTHVALVGEPADPNCQIIEQSIRSLDTEGKEIEIEDEVVSTDTTKAVEETRSLEVKDNASIQVIASAPLANQELQVKEAIRSIGEKYGATAEAEEFIASGKSAEEFLIQLTNNKRGNNNMSPDKLEGTELQRFSLGKAVLAVGTRDLSKATYEIGISRELGAKQDELIVPFESIYQRDFTAADATHAGNLIATDLRTDMFSPLAVDNPATVNLGTKVISGINSNISWPKQVTKPVAKMKSETGDAEFSNSTYELQGVNPHAIRIATRWTNRIANMSAMAIQQMAQSDLRQAMNEKIDQQCMYGTGTGDDVKGLFSHTGINLIPLGADGALLDYDDIVALETAIETNNYHGSKYLFNSKVRGFLKTLRIDPGSGIRALANDGLLNGYSHVISNVIKSDLSKGTGTNLSPVLFGDWSQTALFIYGSGLRLQLNPYSDDLQGMIRVVAEMDIDYAIVRENAISAIMDAKLA